MREVIVAQLGARMHYAVPRILTAAGHLNRLFTDFCANRCLRQILSVVPWADKMPLLSRALGRVPSTVPENLIHAFNLFGLNYALRLRSARPGAETTRTHLWAGREFCRRINEHGLDTASVVYAFNSAALELFRRARAEGVKTVLEQTIAPKEMELELLQRECEKFPGWEDPPRQDALAMEFAEREAQEWSEADSIICGSNFVRQGIAKCGGPEQKCNVVPYGVDPPFETRNSVGHEARIAGPLRVLTVGTVGIRKGSPYVLEVAKALRKIAKVRMVGTLGVASPARRRLAENVELCGAVPRSKVGQHYQWADLFLFPSICEGSATVVYEALNYGLPVICTPNAGSTVQNGLNGFIIPSGNAEQIIAVVEKLATDPALLQRLKEGVRATAAFNTTTAYGHRLLSALELLPDLQPASRDSMVESSATCPGQPVHKCA